MVNLSVPANYTFSPAEATPHLTINHDVAADLDSSNAFEGLYKHAGANAYTNMLQGQRNCSRCGLRQVLPRCHLPRLRAV